MLLVSRVLTVSGLKISGPISLLSMLIQRPSFTVEPASTPGITSILPGEVVPPPAGSNRSCPGEVALAPLNLTLLSWSESNHSAWKIELLSRTGNDPLLHKTEMSNLIQMIYFQRKKWYPPPLETSWKWNGCPLVGRLPQVPFESTDLRGGVRTQTSCLMAHLHCLTRTQVRTRIRIPYLMATLYCTEHGHIAQTQTRIPTPYLFRWQESESESVPESISGNVSEPLGSTHYVVHISPHLRLEIT